MSNTRNSIFRDGKRKVVTQYESEVERIRRESAQRNAITQVESQEDKNKRLARLEAKKRRNSIHELSNLSQQAIASVSDSLSINEKPQVEPDNWNTWKSDVIKAVKEARRDFYTKYKELQTPGDLRKELGQLLTLCFHIEVKEGEKSNPKELLDCVKTLHSFLSNHPDIVKKLGINIHQSKVITDTLHYRYHQLSLEDLLKNGIELANSVIGKNIQNDIKSEIELFHNKIARVKNYYEFNTVIRKSLEENENSLFAFLSGKRIKLRNYINGFQKHFNLYLLSQQSVQEKDKTSAKAPNEFLNVHIQVFNNNLCEYLDTQGKKAETSLTYKIMKPITSTVQTLDEINLIKKLRDDLLSVDKFIHSPEEYLKIIKKITQFFQNNKVSKPSATVLNYLKWQIYARVLIQNDPVKANGFKLLPSSSNSEPNKEKFYRDIPEFCRIKASWEFNKVYVYDFKKQLETINSGFSKHLLGKVKDWFFPPQLGQKEKFLAALQTKITDILNEKNQDSRKNVFSYLNLLRETIKELENNKLIDQQTMILNLLKAELSRFLEFIIYNNSMKFRFDKEDIAFINVLALDVFPTDKENKVFKNDINSLKSTMKIGIREHLQGQLNLNDSEYKTIFREKYVNKHSVIKEKITELKENENINDVKNEKEKIESVETLKNFNDELKKAIRSSLLGAMLLHEDVVKDPSDKAKDIKGILGIGGMLANFIPVVGSSLKAVIKLTEEQYSDYLAKEQNKMNANNANVVPLKQLEDFVEYIARKLTEIYEQQICLLLPSSYNALINVMVRRMEYGLSKAEAKTSEDLAQIAVLSVLKSKQIHGYCGEISTSLYGLEDKSIFDCKGYTAEAMLSTCGVVVYDAQGKATFYGKYNGEHELYGFRQGTLRDVKQHNLHKLTKTELKKCKELMKPHALDYKGLSKPTFSPQLDDERINERLAQHGQNVDQIRTTSNRHGEKLNHLEQENKDLQIQITTQDKNTAALKNKVATQGKKIKKLEEANEKLQEENAKLKQRQAEQEERNEKRFAELEKNLLGQKPVQTIEPPKPEQPKSVFDFLGNRLTGNRVTR